VSRVTLHYKSSRVRPCPRASRELITRWLRTDGRTGAVTWRKSSYSGNSGGQCVEVGNAAALIAVRDSKDPDGSVLAFAAGTWRRSRSGEGWT